MSLRLSVRALLSCVLCCLLMAWGFPSYAMSDADKAIWGASEKVETSFYVPSSQGIAVMGKAQGLISQWNNYDGGMTVMKIQTVTDSLIETYNPTDIGNVGFNVIRTTLPQGDQISVSTMYYTGNLFSISRDRKDADKRAHLLSYVLQVYAKSLAVPVADTPLPLAAPAPTSKNDAPELSGDFEAYMKIIRLQLSEGKYELALNSLEGLKGVIADKQKPNGSKNVPPLAPTVVAPTPTGVQPTNAATVTGKPAPGS